MSNPLSYPTRPIPLSDDDGGTRAPDLDALYRAHGRTVLRWVVRLGGPRIDAEDAVHDVFLVAKRRLGPFDGPGKVTTWLFRTTEKVVKAARRKQRLRHWLSLSAEPAAAGISMANPTPGEVLERRREAVDVYRILDRLPSRQRQVLILFELEEMSTDEIAALIGAKGSTVRVWLFRARARFLAEHDRVFPETRRGNGQDPAGREDQGT